MPLTKTSARYFLPHPFVWYLIKNFSALILEAWDKERSIFLLTKGKECVKIWVE